MGGCGPVHRPSGHLGHLTIGKLVSKRPAENRRAFLYAKRPPSVVADPCSSGRSFVRDGCRRSAEHAALIDRQCQLKAISIGNRSGIGAGIDVFAAFGDAPPLVFGVVGFYTVHGGDKEAVLTFFSLNQSLCFQRRPQIVLVCGHGEGTGILFGNDDLNGQRFFSRSRGD